MTDEKLRAAFDGCRALLPLLIYGGTVGAPARAAAWATGATERVAMRHVAWMIDEGQKLVDDGRIEKAMRWLGFVQGTLWAHGFGTIEDLKNLNRPDE